MARKKNVLCAGTCGQLMWGGSTSLPPGQAMCLACRAGISPPPPSAPKRVKPPPTCTEPGCDRPYDARGLCKHHYAKVYGVEKRKARQRAKTHLRRAVGRYTDITPEWEAALRDRTAHCPLCSVKLVNEPYRPASKELDHMIPLNPLCGGTHTMGNVRITCRQCNGARPHDGSDYLGPVTLWAQDFDVVSETLASLKLRIEREPKAGPIKIRPTCSCGEWLWRGRCYTCQPKRPPTYIAAATLSPEQNRDRALRAAEMRSDGATWWDIADTLGYGRESSAILAAQKVAMVVTRPHKQRQRYMPPPPSAWDRYPAIPTKSCVDCGDPVVRGGRCLECWTEVNESDAA